jgi:hypothetical protein
MVYVPDAQKAIIPDVPVTDGTPLDIELKAALEHARRLTEMYGVKSLEVAVAWDAVEELLSAKAHRRETPVSSLTQYCDLNPDAPECRLYDV